MPRRRIRTWKSGAEIIAAKPTDVLGRIAAQTAKQVILQKVREAERDTIFNEYHTRVGELVTVIVKRAEGPDLIVDMGRTEARLPKREQSKLETYNIGERLRVVIKMVDRAAKGPQVIVSRADACAGAASVRNGSSRNLRRHGADPFCCARSR